MKIKYKYLCKLPEKLVGVMKKCTTDKGPSRKYKNSSYNGINRNIVKPEISAMCYANEENRPPGVEIVELKSSSSEQSVEEPQDLAHAWSYVNTSSRRVENDTNSHEKRNLIDKTTSTHDYPTRFNEKAAYLNLSTEAKSIYNNIMATEYLKEQFNFNNRAVERGPTFFTRTKHEIDTESSGNEKYQETGFDYKKYIDDNSDTQSEDAWMYYRCGRRIQDYGFEITSDTKQAIQVHEVNEKNTQTSRLSTPMPKIVVPKLDLGDVNTFHTLTEVTEPTEHSTSLPLSVQTKKSKLKRCDDKSQNINWLGLSPRDQIRSYFEKHILKHDLGETPRNSLAISEHNSELAKQQFINESRNSNECDKDELNSIQNINDSAPDHPILHNNFTEEEQPSGEDTKQTNTFINEDMDVITEEEHDRDVNFMLNTSNVEPHTTIIAEVNDVNNVTYVVYKYRKSLTDEQFNLFKNAEAVLLLHDKSTQVSAAQLTRHVGIMDLIRLFRGNYPRQDCTERRSWIWRFSKCFCCK